MSKDPIPPPVATNPSDYDISQRPALAFCADENYAPYLGTAIHSVLACARDPALYDMHVIDGGISEDWKAKIIELTRKHGARAFFYKASEEFLKGLPTTTRLPEAAYMRLCIGHLLPKSIRRIIYLDCDVLVLSDLQELWTVSLEGFPVGAAKDEGIETSLFGLHHKRALDLRAQQAYFNSGVMLIDLHAVRDECTFEKTVETIRLRRDQIKLADQDGLNVVLAGRYKLLGDEWNYQKTVPSKRLTPKIVHFCDIAKPWMVSTVHPYKLKYLKHLKLAASNRSIFPGYSVIDVFEHFLVSAVIRLRGANLLTLLKDALAFEAPYVLGNASGWRPARYAFALLYLPSRAFFEIWHSIYLFSRPEVSPMPERIRLLTMWIFRILIEPWIPAWILGSWNRTLSDCTVPCECCGTFAPRRLFGFDSEICPICCWQKSTPRSTKIGNEIEPSLANAQANFREMGCSSNSLKAHSRRPRWYERKRISRDPR